MSPPASLSRNGRPSVDVASARPPFSAWSPPMGVPALTFSCGGARAPSEITPARSRFQGTAASPMTPGSSKPRCVKRWRKRASTPRASMHSQCSLDCTSRHRALTSLGSSPTGARPPRSRRRTKLKRRPRCGFRYAASPSPRTASSWKRAQAGAGRLSESMDTSSGDTPPRSSPRSSIWVDGNSLGKTRVGLISAAADKAVSDRSRTRVEVRDGDADIASAT